jgi:FkbM family methyltransferase
MSLKSNLAILFPGVFGINNGANTSMFEGFAIMDFLINCKQNIVKYEVYDIGSHLGNWSAGFIHGNKGNVLEVDIKTFDPLFEPINLQTILIFNKSYEYSRIVHRHYPVAISRNSNFLHFDTLEMRESQSLSNKKVECMRMIDIIEKSGTTNYDNKIRILKIDVEGFEFELLRAPIDLSEWKVIQFEISKYTFKMNVNINEFRKIFEKDFMLFVVSPNGLLPMTIALFDLIEASGTTNLVAISKDLIK